MGQTEIVILAGGAGSRMGGNKPKVLHEIGGLPMLRRVVNLARELNPAAVHVVTPPGQEQAFADCLSGDGDIIVQAQPNGTGDALATALPAISASADVLVVYGDMPLLQANSLRLLQQSKAKGADMVVLTAVLPDPKGYGRIIRGQRGAVVQIVEDADLGARDQPIQEVNTGICLASKANFVRWLKNINRFNQQSEFYLTDTVALAANEGCCIDGIQLGDIDEAMGVNDLVQLAAAEAVQQKRASHQLLRAGVTMLASAQVTLRGDLAFGQGCCIDAGVVLTGPMRCGDRVHIGAYCVLDNCSIGDDVVIEPFCHISHCEIKAGAQVGPYARLRAGTNIGAGAEVGNFIEVSRTTIGAGTKAKHLSYLGDAHFGRDCNVGAGAVFCNYDGNQKHKTELGDEVFIGSNSTLVAPLKLQDQAYVTAGSVVTRDVGKSEAVIGRVTKQKNIRAALLRRRLKHKKDQGTGTKNPA